MSTKEQALETIKDLPDDVSWRQIEERIRFMAGVEDARAEVRGGEAIPHEEVCDLLPGWISR
jgi:hypothetical protein